MLRPHLCTADQRATERGRPARWCRRGTLASAASHPETEKTIKCRARLSGSRPEILTIPEIHRSGEHVWLALLGKRVHGLWRSKPAGSRWRAFDSAMGRRTSSGIVAGVTTIVISAVLLAGVVYSIWWCQTLGVGKDTSLHRGFYWLCRLPDISEISSSPHCPRLPSVSERCLRSRLIIDATGEVFVWHWVSNCSDWLWRIVDTDNGRRSLHALRALGDGLRV